jgi:hypothetical protein
MLVGWLDARRGGSLRVTPRYVSATTALIISYALCSARDDPRPTLELGKITHANWLDERAFTLHLNTLT